MRGGNGVATFFHSPSLIFFLPNCAFDLWHLGRADTGEEKEGGEGRKKPHALLQ